MAGVYQNLKFLYKISLIEPNDDAFACDRLANGYWNPPMHPNHVKTAFSTEWFRYSVAGCVPVSNVENSEPFQDCSLFYDSETDQYLGVPYDCRSTSVFEAMHDGIYPGWRRVMFNHIEEERAPLSIMGFDLEHHVLASPESPRWMPEFLMSTFRLNYENFLPARSSLAGDLALFIAFTVFSLPRAKDQASLNRLANNISNNLRFPYWIPHGRKSGS